MSDILQYLAPIRFAEPDKINWIDGNKLWVHVIPYGQWDHPKFGEVVVDHEVAKSLKANFDTNVRGTEINLDYEHGLDPAKGKKASAWFRQLEVKDNGVHALVEFTPTAKQEVADGEWKYISGDWYPKWQHPDTKAVLNNVLVGGGLTNRPYTKKVMPINFSEVVVERDDITAEHVVHEHSEPGTGGEETIPEFTGPDDDSVGSRIDTPPEGEDGTVPDRSDTVTRNEGGEQVDEKELRELLGIGPDADITATVKDIKTKAESFDGLQNDVNTQRQFAEQYPDQHSLLTRLLKRDHEFTARQFSEEVGGLRFKEQDGDTKKDGNYGLSALAITQLEEAAVKFSEGSGGLAEFRGALTSIFENGLVDYGEAGSSREAGGEPAGSDDVVPNTVQEVRIAFSEKVAEVMDQDGIEDYNKAVTLAGEKYPQLAKAYQQGNSSVLASS